MFSRHRIWDQETAPTDNVVLANEVAKRASFAADPFERVVRHVRGEAVLKTSDVPAVLGGYLRGMEQLVAYLDRYQATAA